MASIRLAEDWAENAPDRCKRSWAATVVSGTKDICLKESHVLMEIDRTNA